MPRKKATARWDFDPVQPLTISASARKNGGREPTNIRRFSPTQFKKIRTHLGLKTGKKANLLKHELEYLCASAARTKFQDEDGPKRGERMVALQQFSTKIDQFKALLAELQNSGSNSLGFQLDKIITTKWKVPESAFELTTNLITVLKHISLSSPRLAKSMLVDSSNAQLKRLATEAVSLAGMIEVGGDAMHPMFMYRFQERYLEQQETADETMDNHLALLINQLTTMKSATDELYREYRYAGGARKATTIPDLELRLAHLYEVHSGRMFTHNPYKGCGNYCGKPTSHGGAFIRMVLDALLLTRVEPLTSGLRDVVKRLKEARTPRLMLSGPPKGTDFVRPKK